MILERMQRNHRRMITKGCGWILQKGEFKMDICHVLFKRRPNNGKQITGIIEMIVLVEYFGNGIVLLPLWKKTQKDGSFSPQAIKLNMIKKNFINNDEVYILNSRKKQFYIHQHSELKSRLVEYAELLHPTSYYDHYSENQVKQKVILII